MIITNYHNSDYTGAGAPCYACSLWQTDPPLTLWRTGSKWWMWYEPLECHSWQTSPIVTVHFLMCVLSFNSSASFLKHSPRIFDFIVYFYFGRSSTSFQNKLKKKIVIVHELPFEKLNKKTNGSFIEIGWKCAGLVAATTVRCPSCWYSRTSVSSFFPSIPSKNKFKIIFVFFSFPNSIFIQLHFIAGIVENVKTRSRWCTDGGYGTYAW